MAGGAAVGEAVAVAGAGAWLDAVAEADRAGAADAGADCIEDPLPAHAATASDNRSGNRRRISTSVRVADATNRPGEHGRGLIMDAVGDGGLKAVARDAQVRRWRPSCALLDPDPPSEPGATRVTCDCHNADMSERHWTSGIRGLGGLLALAVVASGCGSSSVIALPSPSDAAATLGPAPSPAMPIVTSPPATPSPTAPPTVAVVPVTGFRSSETSVDAAEVAATLAGTSKRFTKLELVAGDAAGVLAAVGAGGTLGASGSTGAVGSAEASAAGDRLILAATAADLASDLAANQTRLGIIRASQVGPNVRALAWGGISLFGVGRVGSLAAWPLHAVLDGAAADTFDAAATWTIAAAGDVMLDRGVYKALVTNGRGADYAYDGGTVTITSRFCCSSFNWKLPRTKVVDGAQAVRGLISGADLAMVNLEGPIPAKNVYHPTGMKFSFSRALVAGLGRAGVDVVSLANNHIGNAGRQGVLDTIAALDSLGIAHGGAGADAAAARAPVLFTIDGVHVAFLAYDTLAAGYAAGENSPGTAFLGAGSAAADIRAARAAGAQVVVVFPHWGVEYKATATVASRRWAHQLIDAGADMVIGNHAHWAGAMEVYKGKPIWYALGNFVFDQSWSEETEEGLILELTFSGATLVQARLHPTLILDNCQPNLLDAAGGAIVMQRVFGGSGGLLPW
jgi:poly-gamma-glutamate capsule biosynthesis protein CapA/YwtB (metallophosphatase superfamily)